MPIYIAEWKLLFVICYAPQQNFAVLADLPNIRKLIWGSGHFVLEAIVCPAFDWIGQGCKKVGRCDTIGANKPQLSEVGFCSTNVAKEYLTSLIKEHNLVKNLRQFVQL